MHSSIFLITLLILGVVNAEIDFDQVRPIEDKLKNNPERFPWYAELTQKLNVSTDETSGRITGGAEAFRGQFPYMAALYITESTGIYFCGGVIIGQRTILTTAVCLEAVRSIEVILGAHNIRYSEPEQIRYRLTPDAVRIHYGYNPNSMANDIALINMPSNIPFNSRIGKLFIPNTTTPSPDGDYGIISGWGIVSDSSSSLSEVLRYINALVISNSECANFFGSRITSNNLCASGAGGKSACSGDAGSPLVASRSNDAVHGLVSFGYYYCQAGYPHVYTRVLRFVDWIRSNSLYPVFDKMHLHLILFALISLCQVDAKIDLDEPSSKITGGSEAAKGQFPYMVGLYVTRLSGTTFCGGAIIGPRTVLTSAGCLESAISVEVVLGAHNIRFTEPEQIRVRVSSDRIKIHQNWNSLQKTNDIALINLLSSIPFDTRIKKINLPYYDTKSGESCLISGWGYTSDSSIVLSDVLNFINTTTITNLQCASYLGGMITNNNLCASGERGMSTCTGDAGSPLQTMQFIGPVVSGISSFSYYSCERGYPHAYTRVYNYIEWIKANSLYPL
uniref:CSON008473 protein n=1 Tax=Culicoides sonorensis TaxID=179676 RepID=A0A336LNS7_CULSO